MDNPLLAKLPTGRLAVAVSGGVDSLYALMTCVQARRDVIALHMILHDETACQRSAQELCPAGLWQACHSLGVELFLADIRQEFQERVITPFVQAYSEGLTPNPCVLCNRQIKFGLLLQKARDLGADFLITGHYAALDHDHPYQGTAPLLRAAVDISKDQSYFLGLVAREHLAHVAFPLSHITKKQASLAVKEAGLEVPIAKESQEICFVPNTPHGYRDFLRAHLAQQGLTLQGSGPFVLNKTQQVIGTHQGLWQYTEGQRRGLGISWSEPLYVVGKKSAQNTVLLGIKEETVTTTAFLRDVNFMVAPQELPKTCLARLRYRQQPAPATLTHTADGIRLTLAVPLQISAPGQLAVLYDNEGRILAAGILTEH